MPLSNFTLCFGELSSESCADPVLSDTPDIPTTPWALGVSRLLIAAPEFPSGFVLSGVLSDALPRGFGGGAP